MAKQVKPMAPRDQWTGIPLPPLSDISSRHIAGYSESELVIDDHHAHFPRPTVLGSPVMPVPAWFKPERIDEALQHSMVVAVRRREHKLFHLAHAGPRLPDTVEKKIFSLIFINAGYVPPEGVDVWQRRNSDTVSVVHRPLAVSERVDLARSGTVRVECPDMMNKSVLQFLVDAGLSDQERTTGLASLRRPNNAAKLTEVHELVRHAAGVALAYISGDFTEAYEKGLLPFAESGDIADFACKMLVMNDRGEIRRSGIKQLDAALAAA